ncbi:GNAT family N-acetyltransferase [Pendulispora brunnea]|uniref:GNAT family N-acetyltransferase n=1 Tax=Pendulispora brunnea TaxID=2905690 RepID=A0ABZ2KIN2_9BACT
MRVRIHDDTSEFWALAKPLYAADPVRHTVALTVIGNWIALPDPNEPAPLLVSIWEGDTLTGVAFRTTRRPLSAGAIPEDAAESVAAALAEVDPGIVGVNGPRAVVERFARAWAARQGCAFRETLLSHLYRLDTLSAPTTKGRARLATEDDVPLLAAWYRAFTIEAMGGQRDAGREESVVRRWFALGSGTMIWEHEGVSVSSARASTVADGMSRVSAVYTPPEHRCHGYGSAVTAAASQWALDAGASHVVLFTDSSNPISNSIYQRMGYRLVCDITEFAFEPAAKSITNFAT